MVGVYPECNIHHTQMMDSTGVVLIGQSMSTAKSLGPLPLEYTSVPSSVMKKNHFTESAIPIYEWVTLSAYHADIYSAMIPPAAINAAIACVCRRRTLSGNDKTFHDHRQRSNSAPEPWTSTSS